MFGKKQKMFRQGDILLMRVDNGAPVGAVKAENKIIAYGEATGHTHRFEDVEGETVQVLDAGPEKFVIVESEKATLKHNEHKQITIPQGTYKVVKQKEYDIMNATVQQVRD